MNDKNVEALAQALLEMFIGPGIPLDQLPGNAYLAPPRENYLYFAERLAAQGVLMPSALTDAEAEGLRPASCSKLTENERLVYAQSVRESLEDFAKGR